jgi:SynChlorMet cassette radical SAM/SPASM protein ScmF
VLPVELFETAIREARPLGLTGVKLTGGEPLMHPDIVHLLEIVRHEELGLNVETNGVLCTAQLASEIAKSENPFVSVSLDGADAATHEWVRGVSGSFEQALQGIRNLVDSGIRPQIVMSLMRINEGQVEAIIHLAESLGADSIKFNVIQPSGRAEQIKDSQNTLDVAELIALGRRVEMELAPSTDLKLFFDYPMAFRPLSRIAERDGCGVCGILGILGVTSSGHYALCGIGERLPELVFGPVGEHKLEDVWNGHPFLKNLREGLPDRIEGICARCLMKYRCLGSCVAQNFYATRSFWAPFWFCERAETAGFFPPTRLVKNA